MEREYPNNSDVSEIERFINVCDDCGLCMNECDFLQKYCKSPKELAVRYKKDGFKCDPQIPFSCNDCSLCNVRCPEGLDVGKMTMEMRREMLSGGTINLPGVMMTQKLGELFASDMVKAIIPAEGKTTQVFFPGCTQVRYVPDSVIKTFEYLKAKMPGTGMILGCCGYPPYYICDDKTYEKDYTHIMDGVKKLGADRVIIACGGCYDIFKKHYPDLNIVSLYTVLDEIGVPPIITKPETLYIHDLCSTRYEPDIHASTRSVLKKAGYNILDMPHSRKETQCCGSGGMVITLDPALGQVTAKRTLKDVDGNIVTYCSTCMEFFKRGNRHAVHILDLIFNPEWEKALNSPATTLEDGNKNMIYVKNKMTSTYKAL